MTRQLVVAAALLQDGRVLAARRSRPAPLAGRWEFPGGKVEPGETEPDALRRELSEELGLEATVGARLGTASDERIRLVLYAVEPSSGLPRAGHDHDALRWVGLADLDEPDWLPIDRELLPLVRPLLQR